MKYLIILLFLATVVSVQAQEKKQSLKDLLYGGKLKKDSSGVIRSTDDLLAKIDTSTKKIPEAPINETTSVKTVAVISPAGSKDSIIMATASVDSITGEVETKDVVAIPVITPTEKTVSAKTNTRIWKEHIDSLVKVLKSEVLTSKKIKKETYFVMIEHEIGTDGQVNILNVTTTPENALLQGQLKQILDSTPIRLNPVLDSANQPKKVKRKQNFSITKD